MDWTALRDTYGPASRIPGLLACAEQSSADDGQPWEELWTRLHHQGTVYTASYAALPALARMARRHAPSGYVAALHLAATIIAATEGPEDPACMRRRYADELTDLHAVAVINLPHAGDDTEFIYGLQALMAFEDGGVWQRNLSRLADGQFEVDCPTCADHLIVAVDVDVAEATVDSFSDRSLTATIVVPVEPASATVEGRLLALARDHDRNAVAGKLANLFGTASCPRCRTPFDIPHTLV